ncbi:MAG: phage replisome organizer N-terminal domain-containing protein [Ruminococcus callidus]
MRNASPKRAPDGREQEELHMQSKRFYWLKLQEHFFQDKAVKKLRRMPNGDTCVMIYLKMLLLSLSSSGELYFDGLEPDFHTELALTLDEDEELVRDTLEFLMRVHRLEQKSETVYYLPEVGAVTGSESASAERMRKHGRNRRCQAARNRFRHRQKLVTPKLHICDTPAAHCDVERDEKS